jgi:hypothetical protein
VSVLCACLAALQLPTTANGDASDVVGVVGVVGAVGGYGGAEGMRAAMAPVVMRVCAALLEVGGAALERLRLAMETSVAQ